MKNYFERGTIVGWSNDGSVISYDTVDEAFDDLQGSFNEDSCTLHDFVTALGTGDELCSGTTFFRYGVDVEATQGYDEAMAEGA